MRNISQWSRLFIILAAFMLIFFLINSCFAEPAGWNTNQQKKRQRRRLQKKEVQIPVAEDDAAMNQANNSGSAAENSQNQNTVSGLTEAGADINTKAEILLNSGQTSTEVACLLMSGSGGAHSAQEIITALDNAGCDTTAVSDFFSSSINAHNTASQTNISQLDSYSMGEKLDSGQGGFRIRTSILWDDSYSFEDRMNCFRNGDAQNQAIQFEDLTAEDRQTVFANLTKEERTALYAELSAELQAEVANLLDTPDDHVSAISETNIEVYPTNPLDGQTAEVTLNNLWGNGELGGGSCQLFFQDGTSVIVDPSNAFNYEQGTIEFNAVTLYAYTDQAQTYFNDLGQDDMQITFNFLGSAEEGITSDNVVAMIGGANMWGDNIGDGVGIQPLTHEYTHIVVREQTNGESWGNNMDWSEAAEIVEEALCTYFPASMTGESKFNEWTRRTEPDKVIDISESHYYSLDEAGLNTEVHNREGIGSGICAMSSALWDMREGMGQETADEVIFNAISGMDFSAGEGAANRTDSDAAVFTSFAQALIKADEQITGGANRGLIINSMVNHGFTINL